MKRASAIVPLFAAVLIIGGVAIASTPKPLTLPDVKGGNHTIDYAAGRLTLVNFWAVWCMPCREEMPEISRLVEKYGAKGLRAVGIAMESGDAAEVRQFLQDHAELKVAYPIVIGDDKAGDRFGGVEAVPTTFLVDSRGKVVRSFIGTNPDFGAKVGAEIEKHLGVAANP